MVSLEGRLILVPLDCGIERRGRIVDLPVLLCMHS